MPSLQQQSTAGSTYTHICNTEHTGVARLQTHMHPLPLSSLPCMRSPWSSEPLVLIILESSFVKLCSFAQTHALAQYGCTLIHCAVKQPAGQSQPAGGCGPSSILHTAQYNLGTTIVKSEWPSICMESGFKAKPMGFNCTPLPTCHHLEHGNQAWAAAAVKRPLLLLT